MRQPALPVFPARAGMNRNRASEEKFGVPRAGVDRTLKEVKQGVPRAGGDEPSTRGEIPVFPARANSGEQVFPARAGMNRVRARAGMNR